MQNSDIFGCNPMQYKHYEDLQKKNYKFQDYAKSLRGREHNFNALNTDNRNFHDAEINAQALGFATNNLEAFQAQIERVLYTDIRLMDWCPMVTNIPEGAQSYSYNVYDSVGESKFISADGGNMATAMVSQRKHASGLRYAGISADYHLEDFRNAMFSGFPLATETMRAATIGCMNLMERVFVSGADSGQTGFINNSDITATTATRTFANSTGAQLAAFIQEQIANVIINSKQIVGKQIKNLCVYLPLSQANRLSNLAFGDNADKTVWGFIKNQNFFTQQSSSGRSAGQEIMLESIQELKGAGASGVDRMIIAPKDAQVFEMGVPIMPRAVMVEMSGLTIKVPLEHKFSAINIKRPNYISYVDGV